MDIDIDNPYICYKITNTANGKGYIGWTGNLERRWKEHKQKISSALKGRPRPPEVVAKILATKHQKREATSG